MGIFIQSGGKRNGHKSLLSKGTEGAFIGSKTLKRLIARTSDLGL